MIADSAADIANLAADAVERLACTIARAKAEGLAVVVAEYRWQHLRDLADRAVVLRDGAIDAQWSGADSRGPAKVGRSG